MAVQIAAPQEWSSFLVSETMSFTQAQEQTHRRQRFYRGELLKIHGEAELNWMIEKKKVEVGEDSDGDEVFYKRAYWEDLTILILYSS